MRSGMPFTGSRGEEVGRWLRAMALLEQGRSQSEFAIRLRVTPSAVSSKMVPGPARWGRRRWRLGRILAGPRR